MAGSTILHKNKVFSLKLRQVLTFDGTNAVWAAAPAGTIPNYSITLNKLAINDYEMPVSWLSGTGASIGHVLTYTNTGIAWAASGGGSSTLESINDLTKQINFNSNRSINAVSEFIFNTNNPTINHQLFLTVKNNPLDPPTTSFRFIHYNLPVYNNGNNRSLLFGDIMGNAGRLEIAKDQYGSTYVCLTNGANYFILNQMPHSQPFEFYYSGNRIAYILNNGTYYATSSELRKYSIKLKNNNNVLERLMKLQIYSYIYNNTDENVITGLVINEQLWQLFPNIISFIKSDEKEKL